MAVTSDVASNLLEMLRAMMNNDVSWMRSIDREIDEYESDADGSLKANPVSGERVLQNLRFLP
jgi:hypothetical protein